MVTSSSGLCFQLTFIIHAYRLMATSLCHQFLVHSKVGQYILYLIPPSLTETAPSQHPSLLCMPARDKFYRCHCGVCCEEDESGNPKNPMGKLQLEIHRALHEDTSTSLENSFRRAAVASLSLQTIQQGHAMTVSCKMSVDDLANALFSATLCDDGPDLDTQPNKLWAPQAEVQNCIAGETPAAGEILDVEELVDAIGQISLGTR